MLCQRRLALAADRGGHLVGADARPRGAPAGCPRAPRDRTGSSRRPGCTSPAGRRAPGPARGGAAVVCPRAGVTPVARSMRSTSAPVDGAGGAQGGGGRARPAPPGPPSAPRAPPAEVPTAVRACDASRPSVAMPSSARCPSRPMPTISAFSSWPPTADEPHRDAPFSHPVVPPSARWSAAPRPARSRAGAQRRSAGSRPAPRRARAPAPRSQPSTSRSDGAHLAAHAQRQVPDLPALDRLRPVQDCGALGASSGAGGAVSVAPAEVPFGEGAEAFFSATTSRPFAT